MIENPINLNKIGDSEIGIISPEYLLKYLPPPSEDVLIVNIGPNGMTKTFKNIILNHTKYDPATMIFSRKFKKLISKD